MQLKTCLLIALASLSPPAASADDGSSCMYLSDMEDVQAIDLETPYRIVYEGAYERSSEGILATARLDDDRVARYLTLEFASEHGRTTAVVRFDSEHDYSVGWEVFRYAKPIYENPDVEEELDSAGCFVVRQGKVVRPPADPEPATVESLLQDVRLVLEDYIACEPRFPSSEPAPTENGS